METTITTTTKSLLIKPELTWETAHKELLKRAKTEIKPYTVKQLSIIYNVSPANDRFYPSLSSLISVDKIPIANLGFIQQGIDQLFKDLYYKDLLIQKNADGSSTFYNLTLVTYNRFGIEIPGTDGLALVLNPDNVNKVARRGIEPLFHTHSPSYFL